MVEGDPTDDSQEQHTNEQPMEESCESSEGETCSESESDSSGESEDGEEGDEDEEDGEEGDEEGDAVMESESSSSDEETERCPICLAKFRDQDFGCPETCDHTFCLQCIVEWSRNVNTCPVDRQVFHIILARHSLEGVIYKKIGVEDHTLTVDVEAETDTTECELCGRADQEDRMLLCDACNLGYHMHCLTPAMERVPRGMWYCPTCHPNVFTENSTEQQVAVSSDDEEVIRPSRRAPRHRYHDLIEDIQIGRTLVRERVLRAITRVRGTTRVIDSDSDDDLENDIMSESEPSTSSAARTGSSRRKSGTRSKKKTPVKRRRRKTTRKKKKVPTATLR